MYVERIRELIPHIINDKVKLTQPRKYKPEILNQAAKEIGEAFFKHMVPVDPQKLLEFIKEQERNYFYAIQDIRDEFRAIDFVNNSTIEKLIFNISEYIWRYVLVSVKLDIIADDNQKDAYVKFVKNSVKISLNKIRGSLRDLPECGAVILISKLNKNLVFHQVQDLMHIHHQALVIMANLKANANTKYEDLIALRKRGISIFTYKYLNMLALEQNTPKKFKATFDLIVNLLTYEEFKEKTMKKSNSIGVKKLKKIVAELEDEQIR